MKKSQIYIVPAVEEIEVETENGFALSGGENEAGASLLPEDFGDY